MSASGRLVIKHLTVIHQLRAQWVPSARWLPAPTPAVPGVSPQARGGRGGLDPEPPAPVTAPAGDKNPHRVALSLPSAAQILRFSRGQSDRPWPPVPARRPLRTDIRA